MGLVVRVECAGEFVIVLSSSSSSSYPKVVVVAGVVLYFYYPILKPLFLCIYLQRNKVT